MKNLADFKAITDVNRDGSLSNRFRNRRFRLFEAMVADLPRPVRLLDIGGTSQFWINRGVAGDPNFEVTIANLATEQTTLDNIVSIPATAIALEFEDDSFDFVFSNSTIEHLFTWEAQMMMAREVRRLAPAYLVQTPNFWFPLEPHFLTVGWQYLPVDTRVALLRRRRFGHIGPYPSEADARTAVEEIRLLTVPEMRQLFPDGQCHRERIGPLTKSMSISRAQRVEV